MKQAVKFTFDRQFGEAPADVRQPAEAAPAEAPLPSYGEADIAAARAEGYAQGHADGEKEAAARTDGEIAATLQNLAASAASLLSALEAKTVGLEAEAVNLAHETAKRLAAASIAARPETEIEAVLRECLSHLNREPHILLRVAPSMVDRLKETVDRMAMERGMSGRIILLGEPGMAEGNCTVEWADGGVTRDYDAMLARIDTTVARYIETIAPAPAEPNALEMPEPDAPDNTPRSTPHGDAPGA